MAECEIKCEGRRLKERLYLLPSVEIFKYGKLWGIELSWFVFGFIVVVYKKHRKEVERGRKMTNIERLKNKNTKEMAAFIANVAFLCITAGIKGLGLQPPTKEEVAEDIEKFTREWIIILESEDEECMLN